MSSVDSNRIALLEARVNELERYIAQMEQKKIDDFEEMMEDLAKEFDNKIDRTGLSEL